MKDGLVLALEDEGDAGGETAKDLLLCIHAVP